MSSSSSSSVPPTELIHLTYEGNFQLDCTAKVISCQFINDNTKDDEKATKKDDDDEKKENEKEVQQREVELILDTTTMHPQGGGQPTDIGTISLFENDEEDDDDKKEETLNVERVDIDRASGIVTHKGKLSSSSSFDQKKQKEGAFVPLFLQAGSEVKVSVNPEKRRILSECHTAGHVVDSAMARCGRIMPPTKGYHFLDGPYVEYKGSIPPNEREETIKSLKAAFQDLLDEDIETKIETLPHEEADKVCNRIAHNFNMDDFGKGDIRVVTVAGWPCPCGGTHVRSTAELKERGWTVTGIKSKKGVVRVKYGPTK